MSNTPPDPDDAPPASADATDHAPPPDGSASAASPDIPIDTPEPAPDSDAYGAIEPAPPRPVLAGLCAAVAVASVYAVLYLLEWLKA